MMIGDNQKSFYYYLHAQLRREDLSVPPNEQNTHKKNKLHQYERHCTLLLSSILWSIHLRTICSDWWNAKSTLSKCPEK